MLYIKRKNKSNNRLLTYIWKPERKDLSDWNNQIKVVLEQQKKVVLDTDQNDHSVRCMQIECWPQRVLKLHL